MKTYAPDFLNKAFFTILLLGIILAPAVTTQEFIYKQNEPLDLKVNCFINNTYCSPLAACNITIIYPNSSIMINNLQMSNNNNYHNISLNDNYTKLLGKYQVSVICRDNNINGYSIYYYTVTPSGQERPDNSNNISYLIIGLIVGLSLIFFFIAYSNASVSLKMFFYTFSIILFTIALFYSIVILQQNLWGYDNIISGGETFLFVFKIGLGIGLLVFFIIIALIMLKAWKIKRGFYDE